MNHEPVRHKNQEGSSLLEALIAVAILVTTLVYIFGAMSSFTVLNSRNQTRTNAAFAARSRMEQLRYLDPATLPATGSQTSAASVGAYQFTIVTQYCSASSYCDSNTRHIIVSVKENGKPVFETETVLTQLR